MGVDYQARQIYDMQIKDVTTSPEKWKSILKLAGNLYRYEFDNILLIYAQRPHATLVADYDTWKKVDRYVMRGSKGIAIFPSRALNTHLRHVFDITDTGGRNVKLTWDLNGDTLKEYIDFLASQGLTKPAPATDRETLFLVMKDFTKKEIGVIMKEDFEERMSELLQLSGSGITEYVQNESSGQPKRQGLPDMEQLVMQSVLYTVGTRCGFDLSEEEQDFSQIVKVSNEEMVYRLGSLVCDVSCSVLRGINSNLKTMEQQKRLSAEGRNQYGRDGIIVHGSGRTALSEHSDTGRAVSGITEAGQIRKDGDEVLGGNGASEVQNVIPFREVGREDAGSGRGSEQSFRDADGTVLSEAQATESVIHDGDVETERAGEDAGRGSSLESGSNAFPLENASEVLLEDEELNRELNELDSFGKTEAGEYHQASFLTLNMDLLHQRSRLPILQKRQWRNLPRNSQKQKPGSITICIRRKNQLYPMILLSRWCFVERDLQTEGRGYARYSIRRWMQVQEPSGLSRNSVWVEQAGLLRGTGFTDMTPSTDRVSDFSGVMRKAKRKDMCHGKTSKKKSVF